MDNVTSNLTSDVHRKQSSRSVTNALVSLGVLSLGSFIYSAGQRNPKDPPFNLTIQNSGTMPLSFRIETSPPGGETRQHLANGSIPPGATATAMALEHSIVCCFADDMGSASVAVSRAASFALARVADGHIVVSSSSFGSDAAAK